ncbi:MAG: hypothetical protein AAGI72_23515 [Pseudomonadota bacterium]
MNHGQRLIVTNALGQERRLSKKDRDFINGMRARDQRDPHYELSGPQNKWLADIQQKLER